MLLHARRIWKRSTQQPATRSLASQNPNTDRLLRTHTFIMKSALDEKKRQLQSSQSAYSHHAKGRNAICTHYKAILKNRAQIVISAARYDDARRLLLKYGLSCQVEDLDSSIRDLFPLVDRIDRFEAQHSRWKYEFEQAMEKLRSVMSTQVSLVSYL